MCIRDRATPAWIAGGGKYGIYTDDKPDEKFCSYDNVGDSYEHHSRFLKENSRYARCFTLAPDDYKDVYKRQGHARQPTSGTSWKPPSDAGGRSGRMYDLKKRIKYGILGFNIEIWRQGHERRRQSDCRHR